jgi:hypothetical protein
MDPYLASIVHDLKRIQQQLKASGSPSLALQAGSLAQRVELEALKGKKQ